ncbi:hypothetical protein J7K86_01780 [bacterium]|nr:hypothetical protein [bacterium]
MKKYLSAVLLVSFLLLPVFVFAQGPNLNEGLENFLAQTNLGNAPLPDVIGRVVKIALSFLGLVAVIIIIVGGFQWMTSGGNEEKIGKAKKLMLSGIVGLVIIVLAYAIASFVISKITEVAQ